MSKKGKTIRRIVLIMVVENAGHGQAYYYDPDAYEQTVFAFLDTIL